MRFSEDGVSMFVTEQLFVLKREQLKRDGRSLHHITEPEAPMFDDLMQACCVVNIWTFCMHYLTTSLFLSTHYSTTESITPRYFANQYSEDKTTLEASGIR